MNPVDFLTEPLAFFDSNCSFGMRRVVAPGSFYAVEDLIHRMAHYGIQNALVHNSLAREYHPSLGNQKLMQEIAGHGNLHPAWVVLPHHTGEFPEPEALVQEMRSNGIRAVRMFPDVDDHNYSFAEWNCGELFSVLEKHAIPLLIHSAQLPWDRLYTLCNCHPDLEIILTEVNYRSNRNVYPLLQEFQNLYIETSMYKVNDGIAQICARFGARRLVFGSGMPVYSGAAAVGLINYASISTAEKEMIAHKNLEALLEGVRL